MIIASPLTFLTGDPIVSYATTKGQLTMHRVPSCAYKSSVSIHMRIHGRPSIHPSIHPTLLLTLYSTHGLDRRDVFPPFPHSFTLLASTLSKFLSTSSTLVSTSFGFRPLCDANNRHAIAAMALEPWGCCSARNPRPHGRIKVGNNMVRQMRVKQVLYNTCTSNHINE
jgi:hypothetical protein